MKTFIFSEKHGCNGITITLSANSFEEAEGILFETVAYPDGWRVDDEDGEDEDEYDTE